jgi:hypothetical protein
MTCQVVLENNFLDVLLSICRIYNFRSAEILKSGPGAYPTYYKHLFIAANAALLDIAGYQEYRSYILQHPICSIWPRYRLTSPTEIPRSAPKNIFLNSEKDVAFDKEPLYATFSL